MEIQVLSDTPDLLRLQMPGRIAQSDPTFQPDVLRDLLGGRGYARNVSMSLELTKFIDSSGLSWLVVCHKRFCEGGGRLVLHSLPPSVLDLFKMMRLDLVLHLAEDESAALRAVRGGP